MAVTDYTLAPGLIDHYDDTGALVPGLFHLNADGSVSFGEQTAVKGVSWTGVKPATVAGAGTSAGTFYSVVAPNGGDSSGAAGGGGGAINFTTGNAGASASGGANGGDYTVNLGSGTGTGRNGQFIINSTDVSAPTNDDLAPLQVRVTWNPASTATGSIEAAVLSLTTGGPGARLNGSASVASCELEHTSLHTGTVTALLYGAESQMHLDGTASYQGTTGFQSNLRGIGSGTVPLGYSASAYRASIGGFAVSQPGTFVGFLGPELTFSGSEVLGSVLTVQSDLTGVNATRLDTAPHVVTGAQMAIPSQGGNTSGTTYNRGYMATASSPNSGGGQPGVGGTVWNIGANIHMGSANGTSVGGGATLYNVGVKIEEPTVGVAGSDSFSRFALWSNSLATSSFLGPLIVGANAQVTAPTVVQFTVSKSFNSGASVHWDGVKLAASTATLALGSNSTDAVGINPMGLYGATLTSGSGITVANSATLYIDGPSVAGGSVTITNPMSLYVASGVSRLDGLVITSRGTHKVEVNNGLLSTSSAQSITLTAAILLGGFLDHTVTTGAATDTLDTGTNISALIPGAAVGDSFVFTINNSSASAFAITLAGATGATLKGSVTTIAQNKSATLTFVNTGANTWNVYVSVSA